MAGLRSGASRKLEQAFAAAFSTYFVGDPSFAMPPPGAASLFIASQAVQKLTYPSVVFMCLEAFEIAPGTSNYQGVQLHCLINTPLHERPDDNFDLLRLHDNRVDKMFILLENSALCQSLMNRPTPPLPDPRAVTEFFFYGFGLIRDEKRLPFPNRLCDLISIETNFRPSDA